MKKSKLNAALKNFNSPVISKMQNLETESYENLLNASALNTRSAAVRQAMASNSRSNALATPIRGDFRAPSSAAQMDFIITRKTANIAAALPIALFGALDRESDYIEVINQYLPAACTVMIERNSTDKKSLDFSFTVGLNTDIVTVTCNQTPYVNYLKGMLQNVIQLEQIKLQISDVAKQSQFNQVLHLVDNSQYGKQASDKFTPNSYKSDLQNQNDIRTINAVMSFNAEKSLIVPMVAAADFSVTINSFVSKYEKTSNII